MKTIYHARCIMVVGGLLLVTQSLLTGCTTTPANVDKWERTGNTAKLSEVTRAKSESPAIRRESPGQGSKANNNLALFYAAKLNDMEKARSLIAAGANVNARAGTYPSNGGVLGLNPYANLTPLHVAASYNSKDVARLLVENGADLNARDMGGETPLHIAATWREKSIVLLLLDHGANANATDTNGDTPLMKAVSDENMVDLLVSRGAKVNAKDNTGETALVRATRMASLNGSDVVNFLLTHGADANAQTNSGETALGIATKRKNETIVALLLSYGAKLSDVPSHADLEDAAYNGNAASLKSLIAKLPNRNLLNWRNQNGAGLLWGAAAQNRPEIVKLLLENGADPNIKTNDGVTPLHEAAMGMANSPAADQAKKVEIATMLLEKGADVNAKTDRSVTPLTYARVNHQDRMADLLRQHGGHE